MDDALALIDHLAARVTASALTGLGGGAAYATYKGFPLVKTSASTAFSFALVSTACFGMERVANMILRQSATLIDANTTIDQSVIDDSTAYMTKRIQPTIDPKIHYGSHLLGGVCGGSVVGFLFHGKPLAGILLLTPIMLGVGKIEVSLDERKFQNLKEITRYFSLVSNMNSSVLLLIWFEQTYGILDFSKNLSYN